LSGESFDIKLNAKAPTVGEAKEQIERDEGTKTRRQLLCRVQVSSDGSNVREFDQEPEELKEDGMALAEGDVIAMGVVDEPMDWDDEWKGSDIALSVAWQWRRQQQRVQRCGRWAREQQWALGRGTAGERVGPLVAEGWGGNIG
jgi:hypothetical protein